MQEAWLKKIQITWSDLGNSVIINWGFSALPHNICTHEEENHQN